MLNIRYKDKKNRRVYFYGIRRSGIHAVSYWIMSNIKYYKEPQKYIDKNILVNNISKEDKDKISLPDRENIQLLIQESWDIDKQTKLIYDVDKDVNNKVIIILRDPFNWIASVYKHMDVYKKTRKKEKRFINNKKADEILYNRYMAYVEGQKKLWFKYAENFFLDKIEDNNIVLVKYNNWFLDKFYRDDIANSIGFKNKDKYIDFVSDYGQGSSFDGVKHSGEARNMDVMNRWNSIPHIAFQVRRWARSDKRVEEYSERIFGYNPFKE